MFIAEIDPSQIATLSGLTNTASYLQFTGGGAASLSVPSAPLLTGKVVRLTIIGRTYSPSHYVTVSPYYDTTLTSNLSIGFAATNNGLVNNFVLQYDFAYDSVAQTIVQPRNYQLSSGGVPLTYAAQTDIKFAVAASSNLNTDSSAYVTITGFRLKTI